MSFELDAFDTSRMKCNTKLCQKTEHYIFGKVNECFSVNVSLCLAYKMKTQTDWMEQN